MTQHPDHRFATGIQFASLLWHDLNTPGTLPDRKLCPGELATLELNKVFDEISTLFQSLPRHAEFDKVTDTYTRAAINSWYQQNLNFFSKKERYYEDNCFLQRKAWAATQISLQRHFGREIEVTKLSINDDPQEQFLILLRQITKFYSVISPTYTRAYKYNAAYFTQIATNSLFTAILSAIAHTHIPMDYFFVEYFKELKNINAAINVKYYVYDPASVIPVTFYKHFDGTTNVSRQKPPSQDLS
jgi:hypothetical protein